LIFFLSGNPKVHKLISSDSQVKTFKDPDQKVQSLEKGRAVLTGTSTSDADFLLCTKEAFLIQTYDHNEDEPQSSFFSLPFVVLIDLIA